MCVHTHWHTAVPKSRNRNTCSKCENSNMPTDSDMNHENIECQKHKHKLTHLLTCCYSMLRKVTCRLHMLPSNTPYERTQHKQTSSMEDSCMPTHRMKARRTNNKHGRARTHNMEACKECSGRQAAENQHRAQHMRRKHTAYPTPT